MREIMKYLAKVEGAEMHYNDKELDVTFGYGIYKYAHPDCALAKYVDSVALGLGIITDSSEWTGFVVSRINEALDKDVIYTLALEFYTEYLKDAHLELFPDSCKVAMMSMYTNSPKLAWKAVQQSLITLQKNGYIDAGVKLSIVDGYYGGKTRTGLGLVNCDPMYFETLMLFNMLCEYVELDNKKYLNGWMNRMKLLTELK